MKGRIKWFHQTKGYGFIETEDGEEIFFHISEFPELKAKPNEEVEFETGPHKDGKKAIKIRRIKNGR
jgi:CspA family cold shock protein